MKPTYSTSTGERLTTRQIDIKTQYAKSILLDRQLQEHGYNFCSTCERNASNTYLDCSHNVSVKDAKSSGRAELCYTVSNLEVLCRECHTKKDGLNIQTP